MSRTWVCGRRQDSPTRQKRAFRQQLGGAFLAMFFAFAPSTIPDWRADPGIRTVAVLPIGEPVTSIDAPRRR